MKNESLYKAIEEKVFQLGNESIAISYENKGDNQHEIKITWDEETEYEVNEDMILYVDNH
ncbi:hypothetical protein ACO1GT_00480 [Staphylococcus arlettae]